MILIRVDQSEVKTVGKDTDPLLIESCDSLAPSCAPQSDIACTNQGESDRLR